MLTISISILYVTMMWDYKKISQALLFHNINRKCKALTNNCQFHINALSICEEKMKDETPNS